jgi:hypothetical protein
MRLRHRNAAYPVVSLGRLVAGNLRPRLLGRHTVRELPPGDAGTQLLTPQADRAQLLAVPLRPALPAAGPQPHASRRGVAEHRNG